MRVMERVSNMTTMADLTPRREIDWTSYSGVTLHRKCPQAWSYRHLYGLRKPPKDDAKVELRFGSWWHALRAADCIERGRELESLKWTPKEIQTVDGEPKISTDQEGLIDRVFEACSVWTDNLPEEHAALWKSKLGGYPIQLLESLWARWVKRWAEDVMRERPVGVEVKWSRPLPGNLGVDLIGYTDEVFWSERRGVLVVRDHKTAKELPMQSTATDMMESQLHLNAWGLKERTEQWGLGPVGAVAYDRVVSVRPTMPKLTMKGTLNKQITRYDLTTYLEFCESVKDKGYVPDPEIIERLSTPSAESQWFQRTLTPVNRNIARVHLQSAVDSTFDSRMTIQRVKERGEAPRNLTTMNCKWCDFRPLCLAQMIGGPNGDYNLEDYGLRSSQTPSDQA